MRQLRPCSIAAPSLPLLQFLRNQAADLSFFTPNALRSSPLRSLRTRCLHRAPYPRPFATTSRRRATLEASLIPSGLLPKPRDPSPSSFLSSLRSKVTERAASRKDGPSVTQRWGLGAPWWEFKKKAKQRDGESPEAPFVEDPAMPFWNDGSSMLGRVKAPNELKLRCTELDENGKVTVVDGEFRKTELIARVHAPDPFQGAAFTTGN